jgi:hypothetical protein
MRGDTPLLGVDVWEHESSYVTGVALPVDGGYLAR